MPSQNSMFISEDGESSPNSSGLGSEFGSALSAEVDRTNAAASAKEGCRYPSRVD
jgi:hypothetical protein